MRNFFWEGHKGRKSNHLVKWELMVKDQQDGGLSFGCSKTRNLTLLSKWGWRYMNEENSLWKQVIRSIHGSNQFKWHTAGKACASLQSLWISISRSLLKIEDLAVFNLGIGSRIIFWVDPWLNNTPLSNCFPRLYRIALNPKGSVADHWHSSSSSWSVTFRRLPKEEEIEDFQNLIGILHSKDKRIWSSKSNGVFSVKFLVKHLSSASPIDKHLEKSLWKTKSLQRVNILVWAMLFGSLNCSSVLQRKLPSQCLSPHICPLRSKASEDLLHLFFIAALLEIAGSGCLVYLISHGFLETFKGIMCYRFWLVQHSRRI